MSDQDYELALHLQSQFFEDVDKKTDWKVTEERIIGSELEDVDPTPDLHQLFLRFNDRFFWSRLSSCEVKWSPRMTLCAGICSYRKREGYCSIRLSMPLLKLRPRQDLVETLLHEMIHAYLFVTDNNDDHDGHGPKFHEHMNRINGETGTKISVYHNFHDEVALYKQHWWKCDGPCVNNKPYYGIVKRSMNRAPGPNDIWYAQHLRNCGGTFHKIKEPEGYGQKKSKKKVNPSEKGQLDIRSSLFNKTSSKMKTTTSTPSSSSSTVTTANNASNTSSSSVQENVRNVWQKKFSGGQEIVKKRYVSCPICCRSIAEEIVNSHIDECLNFDLVRELSTQETERNDAKRPKMSDDEVIIVSPS